MEIYTVETYWRTSSMDTERLVRQHVRNWFCGLTRAECESELSDALDVGHTMKAKAMIEWICEGEFWVSNSWKG